MELHLTEQKDIVAFLGKAASRRASDIHMVPGRERVDVLLRIDGCLVKEGHMDKEEYALFLAALKKLCAVNPAEHRIPQDGRFIAGVQDRQVDFRVAFLPAVFAEKTTVRILDKLKITFDFKDIFVSQAEIDQVEDLLKYGHGLILVNGPTGSGKTTTLYSLIKRYVEKGLAVVTVEDPVEYVLKGTVQTQVDRGLGMTFPALLRSCLRADPDVVMAGEVPDTETMDILEKIAITGHICVSCLHTGNVAETIARLQQVSSSTYLLSASLLAVLNQVLLRKPCPNCKYAYTPQAREFELFGKAPKAVSFVKSKGCDICSHTGYKGRLAVYEMLCLDKQIKDAIMAGEPLGPVLAGKYRTFKEKAYDLVEQGLTTVEEVDRVFGFSLEA